MSTTRLTPEDLAARWQRPVEWIRQNAETFGGFKVGRLWRFDPADIDAYESRHKGTDPLSMTDLSAKRQQRRSA
ncbi:hypothetical protein [Pseudactinotalea sp. Z1732]|uniref:hypothetical protein n=1 Tax=Micrococcales TaxID=85006 RepID=UPI003C7CD3C8